MDLNFNRIGANGANEIANALKVNRMLRIIGNCSNIDISSNEIMDAGENAIADALKVNTNVNCSY